MSARLMAATTPSHIRHRRGSEIKTVTLWHYMQMRIFAVAALSLVFTAPAGAAVLNEVQIGQAIAYGARFKTKDKFLEKGLKGVRVKLASSMAMDGISKYATFFDDWNLIAAESAAANQQMRTVKPADFEPSGMLHAFVEVHARGALPASKMNRRYLDQRAHLVIKSGDTVIQPSSKQMLKKSDQSLGMAIAGVPSGKITLQFDFEVSPEDLARKVEIILIDGDGNRHQANADLSEALIRVRK
jgi:hypothetical protein